MVRFSDTSGRRVRGQRHSTGDSPTDSDHLWLFDFELSQAARRRRPEVENKMNPFDIYSKPPGLHVRQYLSRSVTGRAPGPLGNTWSGVRWSFRSGFTTGTLGLGLRAGLEAGLGFHMKTPEKGIHINFNI